MAGNLKINSVQLGDSATETQNFVWQTNVDGTAKLARGNVGATTQDILTVDASGRIAFPQSVVAFAAHANAGVSLVQNTKSKVSFQVELYDSASAYDTGTSRFTAPVTGVYAFVTGVQFQTVVAAVGIAVRKNGVALRELCNTSPSTVSQQQVSWQMSLTAGDYIEVFASQTAPTQNSLGNTATFFEGSMVSRT